MTIHKFDTLDPLLQACAVFFVQKGSEAIRLRGRFTVALSGGSSPRKLYTLLASEPYRDQLDWSKIYFLFGDERFVPSDDPQSNYRMAHETLFHTLHIPSGNIFKVDTTVAPDESAERYEKTIRSVLGDEPGFDFVFLGLGDDAHTASLFPGTDVLNEKNKWVRAVYVDKVAQYRVTFTAPLLNRSRVVAFLVYGPEKAEAMRYVHDGPADPDSYPAQLVKPSHGEVHWFVDTTSCSMLHRRE